MQSVKRLSNHVARGMMLGVVLVLLTGSSLSAQSDTLEIRPSDPQPRASQQKKKEESFSEQKQIVRSSIELWEQRVRKKLEQIDTIFQDLDIKQIQAQKVAVDTLMEILADLDEEALAIVQAHGQVEADLRLYREALLRAPGVFNKIAENLEERAAEKNSTFLKEAYADFAAEARNLATAYDKKAAGIGTLESKVDKKMEFVLESREFIRDVRELLDAIPTDHGLETERLVARINQYIQVFEEAVNAIKGVAKEIGEQPQPTTPDPAQDKPEPLTRVDQSDEPLTIEEYRQRLAALKR